MNNFVTRLLKVPQKKNLKFIEVTEVNGMRTLK